MTEIAVAQRSTEWHDLRNSVCITASRFGEALGVGIGKPYDFLTSIIHAHPDKTHDSSPFTRHGVECEPIIREAYELLSGYRTKETGFWLSKETDPLYKLVGASPDALVVSNSGKTIGLAEFKAPVFTMYSEKKNHPHGIPRNYMAQIQGQMAVCDLPWCDFMAVCVKTREVMLKRVHYQPEYWKSVSSALKFFCETLQEAGRRAHEGHEPFSFPRAQELRARPSMMHLIPGEDKIKVDTHLQTNNACFRVESGKMWMSFDFLMGFPMTWHPIPGIKTE